MILFVGWPAAAGEIRPSHHYVFFDRDRERIAERSFLDTPAFEGAQLKYTWRELEPEKGRYDFAAVRNDLALLSAHGKKLFVQLQDVSFDGSIVNVPPYLTRDPEYGGGADKQFAIPEDDETRAAPEGWVARRWDPAVRERFHRLLLALGKEFDGKVAGINLPETAVSFGESGRLFPKGFTPEVYRDAVIDDLRVLKRGFPRSATIQYANFMPGEWLPDLNRSYLSSVYAAAAELNVGTGGPDLLPYKPGQMNHAYRFIHDRDVAKSGPVGVAVQWGNYEHRNPRTGESVTVPELAAFAGDYLKADYLFWCTQEPYYSRDVIPFLKVRANANSAPGKGDAIVAPASGNKD